MKNVKGMYLDCDPGDTAQGHTRAVKNGILTEHKGTLENEPGHSLLLSDTSTKTYIGVHGLNNGDSVIFYVDNGISGIQKIDTAGAISKVIDDPMLDSPLGFNTDSPIEAEYYVDFKGDRIVAFIDDISAPRIINLDRNYTTHPATLQELYLFSTARYDNLALEIIATGSTVPTGAYGFSYRFTNKNGSYTDWSPVSKAVPITTEIPTNSSYLGSAPNENSGKSIKLTLSTPDTNYDLVEFAVIKQVDQIVSVARFDTKPIIGTGPISTLYSGSITNEEDLLLEEILTPSAKYANAKTITQLNNRLYLGNLTENENYDYQKYALNVTLKCRVDLVNVNTTEGQRKIAENSTFMPGEVYAFYVQFQDTLGNFTPAYHIPGPKENILSGGDKAEEVIANARGTLGNGRYYKFQVQTGSLSIDPVTKTGDGFFSFWENQNETYPNDNAYNSVGASANYAGRDLRNNKVLHHKFPDSKSIRKGIQGDGGDLTVRESYGKDYTALLSVKVEDLEIPAEFANKFVGYRILYAKRDYTNATVLGDSLVMFTGIAEGTTNEYYSTCGQMSLNNTNDSEDGIDVTNTNSGIYGFTPGSGQYYANLGKYIRFHGFNLLVDKPSINPDLLRLEHGVAIFGKTTAGFPQVLSGNSNDFRRYNFFDFTGSDAEIPRSVNDTTTEFIPVDLLSYLPTGAILNPENESDIINNIAGEEHLCLRNKNNINIHQDSLDYQKENPANAGPIPRANYIGSSYTGDPVEPATPMYVSHVASLLQIKEDVYTNFYTQELVPLNTSFVNTNLAPLAAAVDISGHYFSGGDSFACVKTINTTAPLDKTQAALTSGLGTEFGADKGHGCKVVFRYIGYSVINENMRHAEDFNDQSKFYPAGNLVNTAAANYDKLYLGQQNINEDFDYKYNKDYTLSLQGSTNPYVPFNIRTVTDVNFPNLIARSIAQNPQENSINWGVFLFADVYTVERQNGDITNLQGVGNQRLYIHTERSLYLTKDQTTLKGDIASVTLGAGDIFALPPTEVLTTEGGYAGTLHKFGCVLTKLGYVFPDVNQGKIFIHNGSQLDEISNKGLRIYFRDNLSPTLGNNPLQQNGICINYDEVFNRLLITYNTPGGVNIGTTISYSPEIGGFVAFHDYTPLGYIKQNNNKLLLITHVNGDGIVTDKVAPKIYVQSKNDRSLTFLGDTTIPPFKVSLVMNPEPYISKMFSSISWVTEVGSGEKATFDKISVTSPNRTTGTIDLKNYSGISTIHNQNLRRTELEWNFNGLRGNLDKPWYQQSRFIDNYVEVILTYNNIAKNDFRVKLLDSNIKYRRSSR